MQVATEMNDRFGPPPAAAGNLLAGVELKVLMRHMRSDRLDLSSDGLMAYFTQTEGLNLDRLLAMAQDAAKKGAGVPRRPGQAGPGDGAARPWSRPSNSCNTSAAVVTRAGNMAGLITSQQTATWRAPRGILWAVVILLALVLAACSSTEARGPARRGQGGRQAGYFGTIQFQGRLHGAWGETPPCWSRSSERAVVEDLVGRALVLAEAERQGVVLLPEELDKREEQLLNRLEPEVFVHNLAIHGISKQQWRRELASQLLMEKALRLILRPGIRVTPSEIAAYYRDHRERVSPAGADIGPARPVAQQALAQKLVEPGARRAWT